MFIARILFPWLFHVYAFSSWALVLCLCISTPFPAELSSQERLIRKFNTKPRHMNFERFQVYTSFYNGAAARPASGSERQGYEGESGKRLVSRPGGAPVPEDSESAELGQGQGGAGEPGPPPRNVSQGHPGP